MDGIQPLRASSPVGSEAFFIGPRMQISSTAASAAHQPRVCFTRDELKQALADERIFAFDPPLQLGEEYCGHRLDDYPYIVFAEYAPPGRYLIAEAWHVNERGEIYPGHICPVPVVISEVSNIELAPRPLRQKILAHIHQTRALYAGFINEPTMRVAQVMTSDAQIWAQIADLMGGADQLELLQARLRAYASAHRQLFAPTPIALSEVDWAEVADQFHVQPVAKPEKVSTSTHEILVSDARGEGADKSGTQDDLPARDVPTDVLRILQSARADGNYLYLPRVQLDRKLYERVDKVLRDLGGQWVGGSRRAHKFESETQEILEAVLATGRYVRPSDLGFFQTPPAIVQRLLAKAGLQRGMQVLEPNAGRAAIATPMAAAVGDIALVHVCDILERNVKYLQQAGFVDVQHADFLKVQARRNIDAVCMNPPFSRFQDVDHVIHASRFVRSGGTVTSIMSRAWMHRDIKKAIEFRRFIDAVKADVEEIDSGAFRESGTEVATTLVHFRA